MKIATSWLTPAVAVQRSTLALSTYSEGAAGFTVSVRFDGSIGVQSAPVLPTFQYCAFMVASWRPVPAGNIRSVSRVGEYPPALPAAAKIVPSVLLLAFHCTLMVYGVAATSWITGWT